MPHNTKFRLLRAFLDADGIVDAVLVGLVLPVKLLVLAKIELRFFGTRAYYRLIQANIC